jgi:FG-GAP-like repeat
LLARQTRFTQRACGVACVCDAERGPKLVLGDGTETIFLADMTGDGLSDLVRVRNGEVSYWPNLGYGHFGPKVTMDASPRFTDEERYDPTRIRLADIDGSGTADLIYVGDCGVNVCFNRSGNSWAQLAEEDVRKRTRLAFLTKLHE